ncbi:MAG: hypothetical protein QM535_14970 [Limnohabitans sp.]|nr:hypothetical protein [Limnohabitans sp.]
MSRDINTEDLKLDLLLKSPIDLEAMCVSLNNDQEGYVLFMRKFLADAKKRIFNSESNMFRKGETQELMNRILSSMIKQKKASIPLPPNETIIFDTTVESLNNLGKRFADEENFLYDLDEKRIGRKRKMQYDEELRRRNNKCHDEKKD